MKKYCEVCEKETEHKLEEFEKQYECNGYFGDKLVDYWVCQECHCALKKYQRENN